MRGRSHQLERSLRGFCMLAAAWGCACVAAVPAAESPPQTPAAGYVRPINFEMDVVPVLSRYGCNTSGCHGKAEGQNGFKLSVFGFDPDADYRALVMEGRGRRVFPASPDQSLLLRKASGGVPHGGGIRFAVDSPAYATLRRWIGEGLRMGAADDPVVVSVEVEPGSRRLRAGATQQLRVTATWSDGRREDVTRLAQFQANNEAMLSVDEHGLCRAGNQPGSAAVMASYLGHVDICQVLMPRLGGPEVVEQPADHPLDRLVNRRLHELNIAPAPRADDATYLRRVYLDLIGTLPTPAEAREFLADTNPRKRAQLVEKLFQRPEYADYWALRWADLLRVNRRELGHEAAFAYYQWIRQSFAENKPFDQFTRELLTAEGPVRETPPGHFYQVVKKPNEMASTLSQVLLGVRIECAQCHHHPLDRWSQRDYYGMQAYFAQVKVVASQHGNLVVAEGQPQTRHPRSGEPVYAHPLGTAMGAEHPAGDRRQELAKWWTAADNPWFAANAANRLWAHFLGRGLVEPVDDFRLTNPPANPELLDALSQHLVTNKFDLQALIRLIVSSETYQRSATVNDSNRADQQNYSRYPFKRLGAEVLLDAVCQTTGVDEKFRFVPRGSRAIQLWDSSVPHYFLKTFGRPERASACECERVTQPTVGQVLHLINSPEIQAKLSHAGGRLKTLNQRHTDHRPLVEELYLTFFSRLPVPAEREAAERYLAEQPDRQRAVEDLAWSMLNSLEFLFNH